MPAFVYKPNYCETCCRLSAANVRVVVPLFRGGALER